MTFVPADVLAPFTLHCATGSVTAKLGDTFRYRDMDWEIVGFSREMSRDSTHAGENPNVRCRFAGERAPTGLERFVVLDNCIDFCGDSIEIAARGKDNSVAAYYKPTVQLRQFLDGSPEIEIGDMSRRLGMS